MIAIDYQNVWGCILDHLIGNRNRYSSESTYSFKLDDMPKSVIDALKGDDDELAAEGAIISMALTPESSVRHIIGKPYGMHHWVFIVRLLCKATKHAVDAHNRRHKRYMAVYGLPAMSPWSNWNHWNSLSMYDSYNSKAKLNPYRQLIRNPMHEWNFRSWNNRENKHKIRIMWKEYCQKWEPWFTPRRHSDRTLFAYRDPCQEKHHAYNVFRYHLTRQEFNERWPQ